MPPLAHGPSHARGPVPRREIATIDDVLRAHATELGGDLTGYRNHAYRVANLCLALRPDADVEKVAVAAAFHDIGIWTAGTFDYLEPSVAAATAHLARTGDARWAPELVAMIRQHHRIRPWRDRPDWLVEEFRKADWVDVTMGLVTFGLSRRFLRELVAEWPSAGFHRLLVRLTLERWRAHPLSPLPMLRL